MKAARLLVGLTGLLTILAVTATPASAVFQANQPNTSQGPAQLKGGTSAVFGFGEGAVTCTSLVDGAWHIQTKFTKVVVTEGTTKVVQDLTKNGPHEQFTGQYTNCTATGGIVTFVNSDCSVQAIQITATQGRVAVKNQCIFEFENGTCVVKVPAGNPNNELEMVLYANIVGGLEFKFETRGLRAIAAGIGCGVVGIVSSNAATFNAILIAHSQKVI